MFLSLDHLEIGFGKLRAPFAPPANKALFVFCETANSRNVLGCFYLDPYVRFVSDLSLSRSFMAFVFFSLCLFFGVC